MLLKPLGALSYSSNRFFLAISCELDLQDVLPIVLFGFHHDFPIAMATKKEN